uniref:Histone RNA hairpin-binding protein RNA-binding domain-containing protein n=1 Tax=Globodera rostochiensis TaxID=31243 RepID=A0A914HFC5_GLORO
MYQRQEGGNNWSRSGGRNNGPNDNPNAGNWNARSYGGRNNGPNDNSNVAFGGGNVQRNEGGNNWSSASRSHGGQTNGQNDVSEVHAPPVHWTDILEVDFGSGKHFTSADEVFEAVDKAAHGPLSSPTRKNVVEIEYRPGYRYAKLLMVSSEAAVYAFDQLNGRSLGGRKIKVYFGRRKDYEYFNRLWKQKEDSVAKAVKEGEATQKEEVNQDGEENESDQDGYEGEESYIDQKEGVEEVDDDHKEEQEVDGDQKEEQEVDGDQKEEQEVDGGDQKEEQEVDGGNQKEEQEVDGGDQKEEQEIDGGQKEEQEIDGGKKEGVEEVDDDQDEDEVVDDSAEEVDSDQGEDEVVDDSAEEIDGGQKEEQEVDGGDQKDEIDGGQKEGVEEVDDDQKEEQEVDGGDQKEEQEVDGGDQKEEQEVDGDQKEEQEIDGGQKECVEEVDDDQKEEQEVDGDPCKGCEPRTGWCTDLVTLRRRGRELQKMKEKPIYKIYLSQIPKFSRARIPNKYANCSRRSWDKQVRLWKLSIYKLLGMAAGGSDSHNTSPTQHFAYLHFAYTANRQQLLGRSIDLNRLVSQRINAALLRSLDVAISKFEAEGLHYIMVLDNLVEVNRLCHRLLSDHLGSLADFQDLLLEANRQVSAPNGRITLHVFAELTDDLLPNFCFSTTTRRFVRGKLNYRKPPERGRPPNVGVAKLVGYQGISAILFDLLCLARRLLNDQIKTHFRVLLGLMPKTCKLQRFEYGVEGNLQYFIHQLRDFSAYGPLRRECCQSLRELSNILALALLVELRLAQEEMFDLLAAAAFTNQIPKLYAKSTKTKQIVYSFTDLEEQEMKMHKLESKYSRLQIATIVRQLGTETQTKIAAENELLTRERFCCGLNIIEMVLNRLRDTLLSDPVWRGPVPSNGVMWVDECHEFYRLWSAFQLALSLAQVQLQGQQLSFIGSASSSLSSVENVYGTLKKGVTVGSSSISMPLNGGVQQQQQGTTVEELFGDGIYWAGCAIIRLLGQHRRFEVLDFSYHILRQQQQTIAGLIDRIRRVQAQHNQVFAFLGNYCGQLDGQEEQEVRHFAPPVYQPQQNPYANGHEGSAL